MIGRAGKAGKGKYGNWLNVKRLEDDQELSLNWKDVSEWKPIEHNVLLATNAHNVFLAVRDDKFEDARQKELENWNSMNVYKEVEDRNQPAISVRWVYREKIVGKHTVKKARLVARGYEEDKELLTHSPTFNKASLRVVIAIIASMGWNINSVDIKAAFLQGKEIDREVYLKPPKEANAKGKLWKLQRCVYGLNDASRYWYLRVREELIKSGCRCSKADPAVFYYRGDKGLEGLLISHVDDFIWSGTDKFELAVIEKLKNTFKISEENTTAFRYVGIDIYQDDKGIHVTQKGYVDELKELEIDPQRRKNKDRPVT